MRRVSELDFYKNVLIIQTIWDYYFINYDNHDKYIL